MMVRHIRLDRRQFYLFEGLGINSLGGIRLDTDKSIPNARTSSMRRSARTSSGALLKKGPFAQMVQHRSVAAVRNPEKGFELGCRFSR